MTSSNSNRFTNFEGFASNTQHNSTINTNRLLLENDSLTSKYNQYKQSLLSPFQSMNTQKPQNQQQSQQDFFSSSSVNLGHITNSPQRELPVPNASKSASNVLLFNSFPEKENEAQSINLLKKAYDDRILSLYNNLRIVISKIQTDDLITTMQNDMNSSEFISSRIREILDEDFYSEKETFIAKLTEENASLKAQMNHDVYNQPEQMTSDYMSKIKTLNVEQEIQMKQMQQVLTDQASQLDKVQKENQSLKSINNDLNESIKRLTMENTRMRNDTSSYVDNATSFEYEMTNANKIMEDAKKEIERLNKVISVIEIDLNSSEEIIKDKVNKNELLIKEVTNLQNQLFDSNLKLKKCSEEKKSLQSLNDHYEKERKELYNKCSSFNEDMQNSQKEKLQSIEKKQKEKMQEYQQKIQSQKEAITTLENELSFEREKAESMKDQYSKMYKEMQDNIKIVSREWEKKLKKEQEDFENIIQELETKHSIEMNSIIRENASENESKQKEINKYKQLVDQYKSIDKEFIKITQHEDLMNKAMSEMKKQCDIDISNKTNVIQQDFADKLKKLGIEKKNEYDFQLQTINAKQMLIENDNTTLKQLNNTLKNQLDNLKEDHLKVKDQVEEKERSISKLNSTIDQNNRALKTLKETNDELVDKLEQSNNTNTKLTKELTLSKTITDQCQNLQMKSRDQEQAINMLSKENQSLISKVQNADNGTKLIESKYNELLVQNNQIKSDYETTKRSNHNYSKKITTISFNQRNQNELLIKLLNSKVKSLKGELGTLRELHKKEIGNITKEITTGVQYLNERAMKFLQNNNVLSSANSSLSVKIKELQFKIAELHSENQSLNSQISKFKQENDSLHIDIGNEKKEKMKLKQMTYEAESQEKSNLREMIKKLQTNLSTVVIYLVKIKKNSSGQIAKFKCDMQDLILSYQNDMQFKNKQLEKIEEIYNEEKRSHDHLKQEFQINSSNLGTIQSNFDKLKDIYENKINLLNSKIAKIEGDGTKDNKNKKEQIEHLNNLILEAKNQNKTLRSQLDVKKNEMLNFKMDFEKVMSLKDKKIKELQKIINQSFCSYNSGVDNIHMAKKLDVEVKVLMQKEKNEEGSPNINVSKDI